MGSIIERKYDFLVLFDVTNGNPNGDPDAGNMPRTDIETGHGLVSNVCLKRKIRDYVALLKDGAPGYAIYIESGKTLNRADMDALIAAGMLPADTPLADLNTAVAELKKKDPAKIAQLVKGAAQAMYYDVRTFGAVMTGYKSAGGTQLRGPVQLCEAMSVDPVTLEDIGMTRCVYTTETEKNDKASEGTMGRKTIVPYGLYAAHGHIDAALAQKCAKLTGAGFTTEDLELFWEAVMNMFEHDRAAIRGEMVVRKLVIFEHESAMGNAPSHKLYDLVHVRKRDGVDYPRCFEDYEFSVDLASVPAGVRCEIRD